MREALLHVHREAVGRVTANCRTGYESYPLHVTGQEVLGRRRAGHRGRLDRHRLRVVAAEVRGVDDDAADDAGRAQADERPVVVLVGGVRPVGRDTASTAGLPAVHDLALVPEVLGVELGGIGLEQVLALGEELVVRGDHARAQAPVGEVGVLGEAEVGGAVVRVRVATTEGAGVTGEGRRGAHGVSCSFRAGGRWLGDDAVVLDALAAQPGRLDDTVQRLAGVGGDVVAVLEFGGVHGEGLVGGEHREVGVAPGFDGTLLRQAHQVGGRGGHPADHVLQAVAAPAGLGPDRGQAQLETGDAAPSGGEVVGLQLDGGRRVVGDDASIVPSASACHSRSWLAASRIGGQHLNSLAPSGTSSAVRVR